MEAARQVPIHDAEFEERLRNYQPSEFERTSMIYTRAEQAGREQGRQEGERLARLSTQSRLLLALLEQRGLAIPRGVRTRVLECGDPEQLERWFLRAVHVEQADALFE